MKQCWEYWYDVDRYFRFFMKLPLGVDDALLVWAKDHPALIEQKRRLQPPE